MVAAHALSGCRGLAPGAASPGVSSTGGRNKIHLKSGLMKPQAEVSVFHKHKEALVKPANFQE